MLRTFMQNCRPLAVVLANVFAVVVLVAYLCYFETETGGHAAQAAQAKIEGPSFDGGTDWLNTAKPISLTDLRGRVVLLDFWTLC